MLFERYEERKHGSLKQNQVYDDEPDVQLWIDEACKIYEKYKDILPKKEMALFELIIIHKIDQDTVSKQLGACQGAVSVALRRFLNRLLRLKTRPEFTWDELRLGCCGLIPYRDIEYFWALYQCYGSQSAAGSMMKCRQSKIRFRVLQSITVLRNKGCDLWADRFENVFNAHDISPIRGHRHNPLTKKV